MRKLVFSVVFVLGLLVASVAPVFAHIVVMCMAPTPGPHQHAPLCPPGPPGEIPPVN